jgi:hypothetical protein
METLLPLTEQAAEISKYASLITNHERSLKLNNPSSASDGPQTVPLLGNNAIESTRFSLIEACRAMLETAIGPVDRLRLEIPMVCAIFRTLLMCWEQPTDKMSWVSNRQSN